MSYTCPDGTTLGEILGLQFNHVSGVATRQNPDGTWELREWPETLGSRPTQTQVDTWAAGIATNRIAARRAHIKSRLRDNDPDRVLLRGVVKVLMQSLVEARTTINDLRSAIVNAASLADLKTRAAAVTALSNRNWQQALTAVDQVIDAGQADE